MSLSIQRAIKRPTCGAWLDAGAACGADRAFQVCAGQLRNGRLQGHQPLCPYPAGEVLRCDADYLLGLSEMKNHPNADLADLRLSDEMIDLLKSGRIDNTLLCELAAHPDFPRLMADLEIYVNGVAGKQVQSANAIVDAVSATIMKQHNPGLTDPQLRQLIAAHIDDDSFCRYVIQQDINKIALDLREAHKDDFFSVPEDNPLEDFLQTAEETASPDSDPEQAAMAFICKRLKLNYKKLSEEEKKWLKKIAQKSDLLKNPNPQRGRK